MMNLLRSEWVKVRSVRSTWIAAAFALGGVGVLSVTAWNAASLWDRFTPAQRLTMSVAPLPPLAAWIACLCFAVVGVLAITSEYATGMIRTSFTATPQRWPVLLAKAGVVGAFALVIGLVVSFGASLTVHLIIDGRPITGQVASISAEIPLLLSSGLSIAMYGLLGLALGAITRSAAASIALIVVLWHPLPLAVMALASPWNERLGSFLPTALAGELSGKGNQYYGSALSPVGALAMMVVWALAPLFVAMAFAIRRDVR